MSSWEFGTGAVPHGHRTRSGAFLREGAKFLKAPPPLRGPRKGGRTGGIPHTPWSLTA